MPPEKSRAQRDSLAQRELCRGREIVAILAEGVARATRHDFRSGSRIAPFKRILRPEIPTLIDSLAEFQRGTIQRCIAIAISVTLAAEGDLRTRPGCERSESPFLFERQGTVDGGIVQ